MKLEKNYRLISYNISISVAGVKKEQNLRSAETDWNNVWNRRELMVESQS